ncbi:hypothetical protein KIL84_004595 [Mauremys mutica]|uniref:Uncharacterized protein n=1 Tax=Mauremys mutica TaxID=74926 RepID=A0A9D4B6H4_9SAUR|nr:hypothetical protein KIL84_004595 [Mauremys mutica]
MRKGSLLPLHIDILSKCSVEEKKIFSQPALLHVDFYQISMAHSVAVKQITTSVHFTQQDHITISCKKMTQPTDNSFQVQGSGGGGREIICVSITKPTMASSNPKIRCGEN